MEKMKKWNQIYEWSKKVRTYFDRDCSASLVDEEDPVVRRVVKRLSDPGYLQTKGLEQKRFDAEFAFRKLRRRNRGRMMIRVGSVAAVFALIFQPDLLEEISGIAASGFDSLFKGLMMTIYGETNLHTDNAVLTDLIATRGMSGMMNTIWLILCAMCFGGAMTASGMVGSITSIFVRFMKKTVSVVSATVCSGLFLNLTTADQYISIILTGNMFRDIYAKKGYESCLLSRTTEDAVTVTSVLIPWNSCGMTQATILSVPTLVYLPYCFFNIISPLMSIAVAAIGYKIVKRP